MVQPAALRRPDLVVQRVGHDVVGQPVPAPVLLGHHPRADQVVECRHHGRFGQPGHLGDQPDPGQVDGAQHGEGTGDRAGRLGQRQHPAQDGVAPGQPDRLRRHGEARPPAVERDEPRVRQRVRDLGGEERVAVGPPVHLAGQVVVGRRTEHRRDHAGQVGRREGTQLDPHHLDLAGEPVEELLDGRARLGQVRAQGGDQSDRGRRQPAQHDGQQGERVVVQLVQVVHHHDERAGGGERGQQARHGGAGPAEREAARVGYRQLQRRHRVAPQPFGEVVVGRHRADGRRQRGVEHPPLQPVAVHPQEPPPLAGQPPGDLGEQPGLADPGLAGHHDPDQPGGGYPANRGQYPVELPDPAHERRPGDGATSSGPI